jgi:hypothetical protein
MKNRTLGSALRFSACASALALIPHISGVFYLWLPLLAAAGCKHAAERSSPLQLKHALLIGAAVATAATVVSVGLDAWALATNWTGVLDELKVEVGELLGALPGDLAPQLRPRFDALLSSLRETGPAPMIVTLGFVQGVLRLGLGILGALVGKQLCDAKPEAPSMPVSER